MRACCTHASHIRADCHRAAVKASASKTLVSVEVRSASQPVLRVLTRGALPASRTAVLVIALRAATRFRPVCVAVANTTSQWHAIAAEQDGGRWRAQRSSSPEQTRCSARSRRGGARSAAATPHPLALQSTQQAHARAVVPVQKGSALDARIDADAAESRRATCRVTSKKHDAMR